MFGLILLATAGLASAQDQPAAPPQPQSPPSGGWRRVGGPPAPADLGQNPEPIARDDQAPPQNQDAPPAVPPQSSNRPYEAYGIPPELTLKPGTFVTVRVNEFLSSDRNRPGDSFSGVLMQPVVVDGVVVAQRGQTVYGRVADAEKARADSPSRLGLELTELTLADGAQMPVHTQLSGRQGGTMPAGQQAGTVIGATGIGAVVGGAVGWGTGAAIGAGAGAAAGAIAVMLTRNRPTVIYPESALTFRVESPVTISTTRAPQAFRYVDPNEYDRPVPVQARARPPAPCYGCVPPPPYWGPVFYPGWGYPGWGPYYGPGIGIGVVFGRGGYYRRWR